MAVRIHSAMAPLSDARRRSSGRWRSLVTTASVRVIRQCITEIATVCSCLIALVPHVGGVGLVGQQRQHRIGGFVGVSVVPNGESLADLLAGRTGAGRGEQASLVP